MPKGQVIPMRRDDQPAAEVKAAWEALGFKTERDMLLDDLETLAARIKNPATTATAVAALSKRKQEVFEQIKALDAEDDGDDDILDDSEDESWDVGG